MQHNLGFTFLLWITYEFERRRIFFCWQDFVLMEYLFELQTERAFQKQLTIPVVRRKNLPGQRKLRLRHHREVGLGFKTPKEVSMFVENLFEGDLLF